MSIQSAVSRNNYTGNGATSVYDYTYYILSEDDLLVTVRNTSDVETTLTIDTDYTVSGVGIAGGGSITLVSAGQAWLTGGNLTTGYVISIRRVRTVNQPTDIRNQGDFYPEAHEDAFDHLAMLAQQQQDELDRSMKLAESVAPADFDNLFPADMVGTANAAPITNATGDGWAAASSWPTASAISGANASAVAAAASAAAALVSENNAATSEANAAASEAAVASAVQSIIWRDVVFITSADSPYSITSSHKGKLIAVDCTGGAISITLPAIAGLDLSSAWAVAIKKTDSGGNAITINRSSTDTIDGNTSKTILAPDAGAVFVPDTDPAPDEWTTAEFGLVAGSYSVDRFSGDGSDTTFELSAAPSSENNTFVYINGVYQQKDTYSLSGTTVTFSEAPPVGTDNIEIVSGLTLAIGVPSDGTVTAAKLDPQVVNDLTAVTAVPADYVMVADSSDSGDVKKSLISEMIKDTVASKAFADSPYTALSTDGIINVTTAGGAVTINLPTAVGITGKRYTIRKTNSSTTNHVTVDGDGSETINGATTYVLYAQYESVTVESDGTNWYIVQRYEPSVSANYYGDTATGHGSTNTTVRTGYTDRNDTLAPYATKADSAADGISITINVAGWYHFSYTDRDAAASEFVAISVNGSALTTAASSLTYAQGKRLSGSSASDGYARVSGPLFLAAGDIVRPQDDGQSDSSNGIAIFTAKFLRR